jgi:putative hemolysin
MEDGSHLPLWGLFLILILAGLNGIFYGFSAALHNLSENEIDKRASEGSKRAILLNEILKKPVHYVNVIPSLVVTSGICIGMMLVRALAKTFHPYITNQPAILLAVFLCVLCFASFGILTFRRIGIYKPEYFALRYVYVVYVISRILYPLTALCELLAKLSCVPFGVALNSTQESVTEEEIISMVDEAHEQGIIEENEAEMIQNIISFNETDASEIMTHRMNVIAFGREERLRDVINVMMEEGRSRYPVYGEDLDDIVGVIHYKEAMAYIMRHPAAAQKPIGEIDALMRQAAFIPETRSIGTLFGAMQSKKIHMAVVVDEYGQTAGIISMEDILEEIVGEIQDEYDEDEIQIRTQKDHSLIIHGLTALEDVEEELNIDFGDSDFETLNGYLTDLLGHIPTREDLNLELVANGYRFTILSLGNKTIDRVRAEKIKEKKTKGEEPCQDIQNSPT